MKLGLPGNRNKNARIYQVKLFATKRIEESASSLFSGRDFATATITYTRRILLNYKGPSAASQSRGTKTTAMLESKGRTGRKQTREIRVIFLEP